MTRRSGAWQACVRSLVYCFRIFRFSCFFLRGVRVLVFFGGRGSRRGRGAYHEGDGIADRERRGLEEDACVGVRGGPAVEAPGRGDGLGVEVLGEGGAELDARRVLAEVGSSSNSHGGHSRGAAKGANPT